MPNPSSGVSPDLGARLRDLPGCNAQSYEGDQVVDSHDFALYGAWCYECRECSMLLVAAIRAETLLEAARDLLLPGSLVDYRARDIANWLEARALTGSQTPNG